MVRTHDDSRFTCCFCLHVRTGTILLGVGQIILHLICIAVLILLAIRPDLLPYSPVSLDKEHNIAVVKKDDGSRSHALSIILHLVPGISDLQDTLNGPPPPPRGDKHSETTLTDHGSDPSMTKTSDTGQKSPHGLDDFAADQPSDDSSPNSKPHHRHFSPYFALCLSTFSLAFCCFLVHGAVARQPTHLLPFFFLQVFDFIISLLTIVGYMSSTSGVRMWLHTKDGSVYVSSMSLAFLMLSISCMVLAFKAYCLGMVWDCYKYLMLVYHSPDRVELLSNGRFTFMPTFWSLLGAGRRSGGGTCRGSSQRTFETGTENGPPTSHEQTNDLPSYDTALKVPANAYAPPPYYCPSNTTKDDAKSPATTDHKGSTDNNPSA